MSRFFRLTPSHALAVALAALVVALFGNVPAGGAGKKSTLHEYKGTFSIAVGDVEYQKVGCGGGERVVGGGFNVLEGNIVHVLGAYPTKDHRGYAVVAIVPAPFQTPGALPARVQVKAMCADEGKPLVP